MAREATMDIQKELNSSQTILLLMKGSDYSKSSIDIVKKLRGGSICYVTLNRTSDSLRELIKKNKVNVKNIVFIDAITKTLKASPNQADGVLFVESPAALTEISLAISKLLAHGFQYLLFDSITNLLIYQQKAPVALFVSNIVNKVRQSKTKAVFYALQSGEQQALIEECGMFVDKVINLGKKK